MKYVCENKKWHIPCMTQIPRAVWLVGLDCQERQLSICRIVRSCEGKCFRYLLEMAQATTRIRMTCSNAGSARAMRSCVAAQYGIQSYFTERNGNFETGHVASIQHANVDMTQYLSASWHTPTV